MPQIRFSQHTTLLDEVGQLSRPIPLSQVLAWRQELKAQHPISSRAAHLHLWLGEWQLAHNQQPGQAIQEFLSVQALTKKSDPLFGLARYDAATALYYEGAFQDATDAFHVLLTPQTALTGYDRRTCSMWLRHAEACAGYHEQHARQGIPEPVRLDPQCGAAALAASLRSLALPYDRKTLLAACRVTGEGSTLNDLIDAGKKLKVTVRAVSADDRGLIGLPKPVIAYVEHDHFISVIGADTKGVSYLCSDCGMWPGGRVSLTWRQWHLLNPGIYATVSMPGSVWDKALAALPSADHPKVTPVQVAAALNMPTFQSPRLNLAFGHIGLLRPTLVLSCGLKLNSQHCQSYVECPTDCGGHSDPVNLANGEEEYTPGPDLVVYNPHGPSVVWQRTYNSLRGEASVPYEYDDFGNSWSQPYNVGVYDPSLPTITSGTANTKYVFLENGARVPFTAPFVPSASIPKVSCTVQAGAPYLVEWDYDAASTFGHYTITLADRTKWVTTAAHRSTAFVGYNPQVGIYSYQLAQLVDRNGQGLNFAYGSPGGRAGSSGYPLLSTISDLSTGTTLLTITRIATGTYTDGNISEIDDAYGRSVYYQYGTFGSYNYSADITQVSQIVPTGAATPPSRLTYTYQELYYSNEYAPFLNTITTPSPTGTGTSTATINYNPNTYFVSSLSDGNGNTRTYTYGTNQVTIAVGNSSGTLYSNTKSFDGNMSQTTETDGAGHAVSSLAYSDAHDPYRPSAVTDGNGKTSQMTWDTYGNMLTMTPPSSGTRTPAVTTHTYNYSQFALGELTQTQEGTKSPTTYAYFEPSGLTQSITAPLPGTVGSASTAVTSFTYDSLGNPLTITRPGNNAVSSMTTTLNYTTDGTYSQPAAIGQPVTVTDNLGEVTHLRYDAQGNTVGVKDALGNETDLTYTIANSPLQTVLPATGQTGSGHAGSLNSYLYSEPSSLATTAWPAATLQYGPLYTTTQYDEGNVGAIRQVASTYGAEGELLSVSGSTEPVSYTYDALYRMSTLKDAADSTTSYFYNAAGYLAQIVYPGAQTTPPTAPLTAGHADTTSFTSYDGAGNRLTRVDGNNVTTTYSYNDPESLLTDITYPSGTIGAVHFAYDAYGRRSAMTDGTGGQTYAYDDDNALTQKNVTWTGYTAKTIAYGFYANGSRQSMNADGRAFAYSYDGVGRMSSLTNDNSETTRWGYLANGWLQTKTLGNGVVTTYTRDQQGRLLDLANKTGAGAVLTDFAVPATGGYDGVGNRLSVTTSIPGAPASYSGTTNYQYDYGQSASPQMNRSQLTQETSTRNTNYTNVFGYDGGTSGGPGNPTSFEGVTSSFNADNQQTGTGYGYDGNGSPTTYKSAGLTFDPENRMTALSANSSANAYAYDGDGHQVSKQLSLSNHVMNRSYRLYDGDALLRELYYHDTGSLQEADNSYTFGADGLISARDVLHNSTLFYTFDERGNVVQPTNSTGVVVAHELYYGYGQFWLGLHTGSYYDPFGFGGQSGYYTDNRVGLILCTHRFYDPSNGRWLTRDPMGYAGGVNLYGYVGNDPGNRVDPLGLFTISINVGVDTEGVPIIGPITGGAGLGGTISIDSAGTVGIGGYGQGQLGIGGSGEAGVGVGFSPGNIASPGSSGVGISGETYVGGGFDAGPVVVQGNYPITSYPAGSGSPSASVNVGVGEGGSGFVSGGVSGSVNFNLPTLINNFFPHNPIPTTSPQSCPSGGSGPAGDPTLTPLPQQ